MKKQVKQNKIKDITNYTLLHDNILVRGIKIEDVDGILKPDSYDDKPHIGLVIAVGLGRLLSNPQATLTNVRIPLAVKMGQVVLFNQYSSTKYNLDGNDYFIVREEDVVGFLDNEKL